VTLRTRSPLVCECGHTGSLLCKENDQPYSESWEAYSLEGFDGGGANFKGYCDDMDGLLRDLKPTCPKCGGTGKVRYDRGA
jgi:hypothetical protein